jgi:hypothetical protein
MQPNYNELAERQQKDYQASRDPFQYGQQVAQRRYSEMMSNLDNQRRATQQSYGDLYSQARQRAVGGAAAGGPTLSGGMGQQQRDFVSAIEMQELGRIGTAREGASRDLFSQGQAAFSNAQLEGQQATQMQLQNQQTQLQLIQQRQQILDSDLPEEQKQAQLAALGQSIPGEPGTSAAQTISSVAVPAAATALYFGKGAIAKIGTGSLIKGLTASPGFVQGFAANMGATTAVTPATLKVYATNIKALAASSNPATKAAGQMAVTNLKGYIAGITKAKGISVGAAKFASLSITGGKLAALKGLALVGFKIAIPAVLIYLTANALTKAATGKTILENVRGN